MTSQQDQEERQQSDAASASGTTASTTTSGNNKSALQDNIERKGKNAYYFAHAHKATGPAWDGKKEPKLLSRGESCSDDDGDSSRPVVRKCSGFEYHKSNITKYAFMDDGKKVKLYITLEGVGDKVDPDEHVRLDYTPTSFCLLVHNYSPEPGAPPRCLSFGKLTGEISNATVRIKKPDRIIVTLTKVVETQEWHSINDRGGGGGSPDHEVV